MTNFSPEENSIEYDRLVQLLDGGIRAQLLAYPGVIHVDAGMKISQGNLVLKRCFQVYVKEKKNPADLSSDEIIPKEIGGVETDVFQVAECKSAGDDDLNIECRDLTKHAKICGGIQITNG